MPTYVMLANWTEQGAKKIKESPKRVDEARALLQDMGGRFDHIHMTMGDYDMIVVYEAPDDAVAARFTLMLERMGSVRTRTMKAFPEAAFRAIINSLP
ncbi:MAG TPA: GYD domain-containing protein [Stellaceae bacterium]